MRSVDLTADAVHVLPDLPASTSDAQILAMAAEGQGRLERLDRALFAGILRNLPAGTHTLTIVTFEISGSHAIKRTMAVVP